jgi:hypothetical protein
MQDRWPGTETDDDSVKPQRMNPPPRVNPNSHPQDQYFSPNVRASYNQSMMSSDEAILSQRYSYDRRPDIDESSSSSRRNYPMKDAVDGFAPIPIRGRGGVVPDASYELNDSDYELISWQRKHGFNTKRGNTPVQPVSLDYIL